MAESSQNPKRKRSVIHKWIRRGFVSWAIVSTLWFANSVRTQGVDPTLLESSEAITVVDSESCLAFLPTHIRHDTAVIFLCGAGIAAEAYAPLLHPIANAGYAVHVVRLPLRFAPTESHKKEAIDRATQLIQNHPETSRWIIAGHSLGAALSCRIVKAKVPGIAGVVLLGTTHPKQDDLSWCLLPVTKVYATNDRIAPPEVVLANKRLLPANSKWVEIKGGNHSQFGHYGHQLFDGTPTISRSEQQQMVRSALLTALDSVSPLGHNDSVSPQL